MREDRPSQTAAVVAALRGFAPFLPDGGQLAEDPFGLLFATGWMRPLVGLSANAPWLARQLLRRGPLSRLALWMQLRTRTLDDYLRAFGGRQVVLLGAGFDCRALRLPLEDAVFEIDHPATQGRKRAVLGSRGTQRFIPWNFEQPMERLAEELASAGHDAAQPTFTVWEGVAPYLTEEAVAATVTAVKSWSSAGSLLGFTYIEPRGIRSWQKGIVALMREPWRFGWDPAQLPSWMAARGMRLLRDESDAELAARLLPPRLVASLGRPGRHVALAEPA